MTNDEVGSTNEVLKLTKISKNREVLLTLI